MNLPHVGHIGIIVENMEKSMALFQTLFGFSPSKIKEMTDVGLRIATLKAENIDIELIQYLDQGHHFGKTVMGEAPGVNHFSINLDNVETAAREFQKKGIKIMEGFPRPGNHGMVAFFEPETTEKILLEVCSKMENK